MSTAIELADLVIGYRSRRHATTIAAGLNARASRGDLTVLIGPNGAGKSTLIRTLAGLQPALGGRVLLDGTNLAGLARDELARRVAVVLTDRIDAGLLSAREVVALGRIPHLGFAAGLRRRDDNVIDWALAATGARHLAVRPAAELSDGECQRVLTARALAQQPDLLVLDEPTAFLDVSSRAGLFGLLRELAREQQLAVIMSTHDLELALRVADRVWLLDAAGTLVDTVGEELMVSGRIGEMFDSETMRFDPVAGVFAFRAQSSGRCAGIDAPEPLRSALARVLFRANWHTGHLAEIIVTAVDPAAVTVRSGSGTHTVALVELPQLLRGLPPSPLRSAPQATVVSALAELSTVSPYFTVTTGPIDHDGWYPVVRLYTDQTALAGVVDTVAQRIAAPDFRVAASTFYLGFAARLWSLGLGALADHGMLLDLAADQLWYTESNGTLQLRLPNPLAWQGPGLESRLGDMLLDGHLTPLATAVRRLGTISEKLLRGNAASAALGAARALSRHRGVDLATGPGWQLARAMCADERLAETVRFNEPGTDYRRSTCCLFYRTPDSGLCIDCALTRKPPPASRRKSTLKTGF